MKYLILIILFYSGVSEASCLITLSNQDLGGRKLIVQSEAIVTMYTDLFDYTVIKTSIGDTYHVKEPIWTVQKKMECAKD